jgi:hypothetical protein
VTLPVTFLMTVHGHAHRETHHVTVDVTLTKATREVLLTKGLAMRFTTPRFTCRSRGNVRQATLQDGHQVTHHV